MSIEISTTGAPAYWPWVQSLRSYVRDADPRVLQSHLGSGAPFVAQILPELAETLKRIRDRGASDFYEGETAKRLAAAMEANGGLITLEDLKNYQAVERTPLRGHYRDYEIITAPPPSSAARENSISSAP